ncbi:hypothetical protein DMC30DRAFT_406356, partial [Rhodotorula diobovata]
MAQWQSVRLVSERSIVRSCVGACLLLPVASAPSASQLLLLASLPASLKLAHCCTKQCGGHRHCPCNQVPLAAAHCFRCLPGECMSAEDREAQVRCPVVLQFWQFLTHCEGA